MGVLAPPTPAPRTASLAPALSSSSSPHQPAAQQQCPHSAYTHVSMDLPFALKRFCGAEGIEKALTFSGFRGDFGKQYGVTIKDGGLAGLYSRAVVVLNENGKILHTEQVPEIGQEPNYDAALAKL
jgi:thioredoxin-dependent peroxiredoxin